MKTGSISRVTCPECGGWATFAHRRLNGLYRYECGCGHKWTIQGAVMRLVPDGGPHDFPLEETTVYVAGPMAGKPDCNFPAFEIAVRELRKFDLTVLSPHEDVSLMDLKRAIELGHDWKETAEYRQYLLRDLGMVAKSDVVALLPGWSSSGGVKAEVAFASACGIKVIEFMPLLRKLQGCEDA